VDVCARDSCVYTTCVYTTLAQDLSEAFKRYTQLLMDLGDKLARFIAADSQRFEDVWGMHEDQVKGKLLRLLQADKLIHEQQLGLLWFPPSEQDLNELFEVQRKEAIEQMRLRMLLGNPNMPNSASNEHQTQVLFVCVLLRVRLCPCPHVCTYMHVCMYACIMAATERGMYMRVCMYVCIMSATERASTCTAARALEREGGGERERKTQSVRWFDTAERWVNIFTKKIVHPIFYHPILYNIFW